MRLGIFWAFGSVAILCLAIGNGDLQAVSTKKVHPHAHLHHALYELRDARFELLASKHDFGLHREKAMGAINDAIKIIEVSLKAVGDTIQSSPKMRDLQEHHKQYKHHPHLHHAVHELKHAHRQVKADKYEYAGNRMAVLRDIHAAIQEIEALLHYKKK